MTKWLWSVLILILCLPVTAEPNLILNPGFEDGAQLTGWQVNSSLEWFTVTPRCHSGLWGAYSNWQGHWLTSEVWVPPGTYYLSVFGNTWWDSCTLVAELGEARAEWAMTAGYPEWVEYQATLPTTTGGQLRFTILSPGNDHAVIDDVVLHAPEPLAPVAVGLLVAYDALLLLACRWRRCR